MLTVGERSSSLILAVVLTDKRNANAKRHEIRDRIQRSGGSPPNCHVCYSRQSRKHGFRVLGFEIVDNLYEIRRTELK